jgi:hypothetical protein
VLRFGSMADVAMEREGKPAGGRVAAAHLVFVCCCVRVCCRVCRVQNKRIVVSSRFFYYGTLIMKWVAQKCNQQLFSAAWRSTNNTSPKVVVC